MWGKLEQVQSGKNLKVFQGYRDIGDVPQIYGLQNPTYLIPG